MTANLPHLFSFFSGGSMVLLVVEKKPNPIVDPSNELNLHKNLVGCQPMVLLQ